MKSDREFINGVYAKADRLTSDPVINSNSQNKEPYPPINNHKAIRYLKYTGMAAGFLLILFSAQYLNEFSKKDNLNYKTSVPRDIRLVNYSQQLIEQASDIIAIEASEINGEVILNITKNYKTSGKDLGRLSMEDNEKIGLVKGQSAIVFINTEEKELAIIDIYTWDTDNSDYKNQYGETMNLEELNMLENERKKDN